MTDRSGFDEAVDATVRAVRFVTSSGTDLERALPTDRYPDGAAVRPIGWADASLLVAQVGSDVALLTSPDRAESEWTWRTLVEDVPESESVSIAVDLVPDLTGDPDQELTHDFSADDAEQSAGEWREIMPFLVSAGFLVLLGVAAVIGWLRRRA